MFEDNAPIDLIWVFAFFFLLILIASVESTHVERAALPADCTFGCPQQSDSEVRVLGAVECRYWQDGTLRQVYTTVGGSRTLRCEIDAADHTGHQRFEICTHPGL